MLTKRIHNPVDSLLVVLILPDYSKPKFITVRKREFSLFFPGRNNDNKPPQIRVSDKIFRPNFAHVERS